MTKRWVLSWGLGVAALVLLGWLIFAVVSRTTLTVDPAQQNVAAETQLGDLKCRKELKAAFPFVKLECQDTAKRP